MSKKLWAAVLTILGFAFFSGAAQAQLADEASALALGANLELGSVARAPASPDAIKANLQTQGYSNITVSPNDPSQYTAVAPGGIPVLLSVDKVTGKVISAVPQ